VAVTIRKWATFVEELHEEGGKPLARPLRRVAIAVVVRNPYAGSNGEDLTELVDFGEVLGAELTRRAKEALGTTVEAYGKGGIVGEAGELEHVAACLHPKFGAPTRDAVGGVSILPSVKKRGAMGATLDIPGHHIKAMLVRSHFDAMTISVPDAPARDELLLALAVADGGRPHARVGGLRAEDAVGEDGLR
jgi:Amino acid synthesis